MQKLIEAGLYGHELVAIDDPKIVGRYNTCLESAGIKPTALLSLHIDGAGWSPEVASEKGDTLYLMNGTHNQVAIVVTPNQRARPVYSPINSFDRALMDDFFSKFSDEIADLTTETGICLDLEKDFSRLESPSDLFLIDAITVRPFTAQKTIVAAQTQQTLVKKFMEEDTSWRDEELLNQLIDSAKGFGDLRSRKLFIPTWQFVHLRHFYTLAFGGVFVFRLSGKRKKDLSILVFEKKAESLKLNSDDAVYHIEDKDLLEGLEKSRLIELNMGWLKAHPAVLEEKRLFISSQAICTEYPDIRHEDISSPQRKKLLADIKAKLPPALFELERLIKKTQRGTEIVASDISDDLKKTLMRPHASLPAEYRGVVWQLLLRIDANDVVRLYAEDKNFFYEQYGTWTEARKHWAISEILEKYIKKQKTERS